MGKYNKQGFEEGLELIPSILEWAEKQDVERMRRFLVQAPNVPMYLFASGGAASAVHYAALLYETNRGMAKPLNPLMMASISDEVLKNSKIFIFSTSGGGVDTRYALQRALAAKAKEEVKDIKPKKAKTKKEKEKEKKRKNEKFNGLAVLSRDNDEDNYLIKTFIKKTGSENWFQYRWPGYKGFVSPVSGIAVMSLFYRAFTGKNDISSKLKVDLNPRSCFSYSPRKEGKIPPLKDIKTFITLYGGWSEPVAYNFENTMIEGGLANVQLSNYRNYGHGRFIYLSNHFEDCAFVLFVTPREKEFVNDFIINATFYEYGQKEVFPPNLPIIIVETEHDSPLATIDLVIKTKVLLGEIAQAHGENPCNPQNKMNIPKGALINMGFKNLLEIGSIKGEVLQGTDGTLKGVNRKKEIKYDPKLSIGELAKKNGVKEPTIQKYIREHNIDRHRDTQMLMYNKVWEEYIKDSERSRASIARALDISENTLKLYLEMKAPPPRTEEGKVCRVNESDALSKLRNKLKGKEWDINLKFKDGRLVKDSQETAIPEATVVQDSKPKETPTRKKKVSQEVRKSSDALEGVDEDLRKKLKRAKIKSLEELYEKRDAILKKEKERVAEYREVYANAKPLTWDDFSFRKTHTYDTSKVDCWSFNSKTDERDGISLQLGNMANGFGITILGREFVNSEVPYQLASFLGDEASVAVQKEISDPSNPFYSNGLGMKRKYIYNKEYAPYRRDYEFELGRQNWCYEWMKWVVWEKVKQNKGLRDILLAIPKNAIIIEQAQRRGRVMWGCWNEELINERMIMKLAAMAESGLSDLSPKVKNAIYQVNCASKWVGENAMGQILTMAKLALNEGVQMPIDAKMLNDAKICWFGDVLVFTEQKDGSVTVEAKPIDTQDKLQEVIQKPLMPKLARTKVTVVKEKKTSQKVRKQAKSQNDGQTVETNFELTEPNKASKKEMLSIKSGDLLDDLLKQ